MRRLNQLMAKHGTRLAYAIGVLTVAWQARVLAATAGGTLPWDTTLNTLQTDLDLTRFRRRCWG